ncbi:hypothetical protein [Posidoniimonas corsicana]|nr:hypothetical protein [Posidoniimonas corsicana]
MAQNLQPRNRFLACRALCTLASAQLAANYGRAEVKATTASLVASVRKTDRDTVLGVECDMLRASIADRNGKEKTAYRDILAPLERSRALGRHGLELDLALKLSTYFYAHDRIAGATALYEHFLPTPAEGLSPHLLKHTLLYATCRKRTGEWKKCLALLSPIQDECIDLENTVDIGIAVLHAEAVGRCGDWPESVRLSRSIVQQLSSREDPDADGGQWASQLLFAYQGLVNSLTENGELDEANRALVKSEKLAAKAHGQSSPWRLGIVKKQGEIAMRQQRYADAAELFGQIESETADNENATEFHEHARSRRNEALRLANAAEADTAAPALAR